MPDDDVSSPSAPAPTAELLDRLDIGEGSERVTVGEVADLVGGRAHGAVLFVLSLPETIPMIGLSFIIATPIFGLGLVLAWKGDQPPMPRWVRERSIRRSSLRTAIRCSRRAVRWLDRISRPRWDGLARAGRLHGATCMGMAILLAIPIPGINLIAAASVATTGLGIFQRDGALIAGSVALASLALGGVAALTVGLLT